MLKWAFLAALAAWAVLVVAVFRRRRVPPTPPQGVVLFFDDGRQVSVECIYVGRADGVHVWRAVWPYVGRPAGMEVAVLPARTRVELTCLVPPVKQ